MEAQWKPCSMMNLRGLLKYCGDIDERMWWWTFSASKSAWGLDRPWRALGLPETAQETVRDMVAEQALRRDTGKEIMVSQWHGAHVSSGTPQVGVALTSASSTTIIISPNWDRPAARSIRGLYNS